MRARLVLALASLSVLVACATVEDIRKKEPVFFGTTDKSPEAYAECVSGAWRGQGQNVIVNDIANGKDVVVQGSVNVVAVLRTQYYSNRTHFTMSTRVKYGIQNMIESANLCM